MDNAIEARGLEKTYRGDVRALKGVSLAAAKGTVFGLLGPNGAGKSTTVKILTTLSRPDAGEAYVAGYDVVRQPGKVRLAIGAVAQKSGLDPQMTGRENLVLQGRVYGMRGIGPALAGAGASRALRPRGGRRPYGAHLLRRHAAQAGRRHRPDAPAAGALPRRAHDRARPGGARRHVARDRPPRRRRGPHDPDDDALPGGGRRPRPAAGDRRPGPRRGRRHARRAQGRVARRRDRRRARGPAARRRGPPRRGQGARPLRRRRGGPRAARAGRQRRPRRAGRARRPGVRGRQGRLGDRVAALARRRVPAVRRPRLQRGRRGGEEER